MGLTFILSGLSSQHLALFSRKLQFSKAALIDLAAFSVGIVAGWTAAWRGFGYWSLVVIPVVMSVVNVVLVWLFSDWRPGFPRVAHDWKGLLKFGGNLTGFSLVNYFARNLDNVLIGRFSGEASLGLYDRAYKLLLMPITQISLPLGRVAMPLLSRVQDRPDQYRKAYLRIVEIMMILTYPGILFGIITSHTLITTVMGERWAGVAPIFAVLGLGALYQPVSFSTGWLFTSQGRAREMRNCGIVSSSFFVASFAIGLHWGPLGVAIAYIIAGANDSGTDPLVGDHAFRGPVKRSGISCGCCGPSRSPPFPARRRSLPSIICCYSRA